MTSGSCSQRKLDRINDISEDLLVLASPSRTIGAYRGSDAGGDDLYRRHADTDSSVGSGSSETRERQPRSSLASDGLPQLPILINSSPGSRPFFVLAGLVDPSQTQMRCRRVLFLTGRHDGQQKSNHCAFVPQRMIPGANKAEVPLVRAKSTQKLEQIVQVHALKSPLLIFE